MLTQLVKFMSCNRDDLSYIFRTQVSIPGVTVCICHSSSVEVGTCGSQGSGTNDSSLTGELQFTEKPCLIEGGLPGHDSKDYYPTFRKYIHGKIHMNMHTDTWKLCCLFA